MIAIAKYNEIENLPQLVNEIFGHAPDADLMVVAFWKKQQEAFATARIRQSIDSDDDLLPNQTTDEMLMGRIYLADRPEHAYLFEEWIDQVGNGAFKTVVLDTSAPVPEIVGIPT